MSASATITITSADLRDAVENHLDAFVPDELWKRAESYARRKLELAKERTPAVDYYDNRYLVLLAADTAKEFAFADKINARSDAIMAARAEMKGATI